MYGRRLARSLLVLGAALLAAEAAPGQQVTVGTPSRTVSDSFFERIGVHWGFNWKGLGVRFGGPNMATPPFGRFDPNAGIHGGFAVNRPGFNGFFNWAADQGYRQSFVTQVPSITLTNGVPGYISDTSQSPFVISYIPVVGGFPTVGRVTPIMPVPTYSLADPAAGNYRVEAFRRHLAEQQRRAASGLPEPPAAPAGHEKPGPLPAPGDPDPAGAGPAAAGREGPAQRLARARASSAGRPAPSLAEARRLHELEQAAANGEARVFFERGLTAEEDGKPRVARIYYEMAAKRAHGPLREQIRSRLAALSPSSSP